MRRVGVALILLLAATGCTGGSGGLEEPHPSYTTTTRTRPTVTTTTSAATTTVPSTTTTTVAPWTTLPEPACPSAVLATELGGPATIDTMCLEVTTGGQVEPGEKAVAGLTEVLGLLGVDVVSEGCQAVFRLSVTGNRVSEFYQFGNSRWKCGSGLILSGESSLVVGGAVKRTWTAELNQPPPDTIEGFGCAGPDVELSRYQWDDELVTLALRDMFGEAAAFAEWVGFLEPYEEVDDRIPTADEVAWLACWAVQRQPTALSRLEYMAPVDANQIALRPLVPYLIAVLDSAQQCDWCSSPSDAEAADSLNLRLNSVLAHILGVSGSRAPASEWWEVWQQQQIWEQQQGG